MTDEHVRILIRSAFVAAAALLLYHFDGWVAFPVLALIALAEITERLIEIRDALHKE